MKSTNNFLNNSVNYSQQQMIKKKLETLVSNISNYNQDYNDYIFYGELYKIFITRIANSKYNTLFIFNQDGNVEYFMECCLASEFNNDLFFLGYKRNDTIYIVDVVVNNASFDERYRLVNELLCDNLDSLVNINNHVSISIHALYSKSLCNEYLIPLLYDCQYDKDCEKIIEKTTYSDVYNVYNIVSKNNEGILYIKTSNESLELLQEFKKIKTLVKKCIYNETFKKFQLV